MDSTLSKVFYLIGGMPRPFRPKVWLSENAFISMVSAAVEAFDDETLGILLGLHEPRWRRIIVQYAVVYQTAKRARNRVKADPKRALRLNKFLEKITSPNCWRFPLPSKFAC